MLASIPAAFALLAGAVLAVMAQAHVGTPLTPADVRDASYGLSISESVDQQVEGVGGAVIYRIAVANDGPSSFNDAGVLDDVPESVTGVSWTCAAGGGGGACRTPAGTGGHVAVAVVLPPRSSLTIVVEGTVASAAAGGTIVNRASFRARSRSLLAGDLILRSDPVTTAVPEPGQDVGWTD